MPSENTPSNHAASRAARTVQVGATIGALATLGFLGARDEYLTTWGSLNAPQFSPQTDSRYSDSPPTYYEGIRAKVLLLESVSDPYPVPQAADNWLRARLPSLAAEGSSAFLREYRHHPDLEIPRFMFQQYGTPRECAALLFRRVTGRELPETTRILVVQENSWPDRGSTGSNHLGALGVSAVREQEYLDTVMTIVHELGHQVCPIGEAAIYEGIMPVHLRAREEAAAYCFEYACMMQFDDPALRDIMTVYFTEERDQQIEKLCAGKITEHSLGMTIADAALSLYPLDLAWKKIGTGSELDPQILSRVDEIRNLRHHLHQLASPPAPQ